MTETYQDYISRLHEDIRGFLLKIEDLEEQIRLLKENRHKENRFDLADYIATEVRQNVPPEMKSELKSSKIRISQAMRMFLTHFDVDGKPLTSEGEELMKKYDMDGWIDGYMKEKDKKRPVIRKKNV